MRQVNFIGRIGTKNCTEISIAQAENVDDHSDQQKMVTNASICTEETLYKSILHVNDFRRFFIALEVFFHFR